MFPYKQSQLSKAMLLHIPVGKNARFVTRTFVAGVFVVGISNQSFAQDIPGSADINRVRPAIQNLPLQNFEAPALKKPEFSLAPEPSEELKSIKFVLQKLKIEGMTAYPENEFISLYQSFIDQETTLGDMYAIARKITERYRADGYFLSRAFVPAQEIGDDGIFTINIIEGYIGEIVIDPTVMDHKIVRTIINSLSEERPIRIQTLEKQQLLLNDIAGLAAYKGTLTPMPDRQDGAVQLVFSATPNQEKLLYIGIDNLGSRYLGPYGLTGRWQGSLLPLEETSIVVTKTVPFRELSSINITHDILLLPDLKLKLSGGYTKSNPGYRLTPQEIRSSAKNAGIELIYQALRQRQENLQYTLGLDSKDSNGEILSSPLSRDMIRALRVTVNYDRYDEWQGYNMAGMTISHGINGLGSSQPSDLNPSRPGVNPSFTKAEIRFARLQRLTNEWNALFSVEGQKASGSLYSSEEFGYGGQAFGRAYDSSEITGDNGLAAGLELRYQGMPSWSGINLSPYGFYDIGKVWNENTGQPEKISGSSTGFGVRIQSETGLSGNLQLAIPLTKPVDTPLYGGNGGNARFIFQAGYSF